MGTHATLSPSGAVKWLACPASAAMEFGVADPGSSYAREGTAAHELAERCLTNNRRAADYLGALWMVEGQTFPVDEDMARHVQTYLDHVREFAFGGVLLVEQKLSITFLTGEPDAKGTADAVIVQDNELQVHDLKYGMGNQVDADNNSQLMIYALAALEELGWLYDFRSIRLVIHQPRLGHLSEWSCSVEELLAFGKTVSDGAALSRRLLSGEGEPGLFTVPGDHCRKGYCRARATCPALAARVVEEVSKDFNTVDNTALGSSLAAVPLIEDWCKAVRAKVEGELFSGREVPGYKLVQGKKGNRKWDDPAEAEAEMKRMGLLHAVIYEYKLASPTSLEKAAKAGHVGPRQWPKLQGLIAQAEGSPSVAPSSDKRPALILTSGVDDFNDLTTTKE